MAVAREVAHLLHIFGIEVEVAEGGVVIEERQPGGFGQLQARVVDVAARGRGLRVGDRAAEPPLSRPGQLLRCHHHVSGLEIRLAPTFRTDGAVEPRIVQRDRLRIAGRGGLPSGDPGFDGRIASEDLLHQPVDVQHTGRGQRLVARVGQGFDRRRLHRGRRVQRQIDRPGEGAIGRFFARGKFDRRWGSLDERGDRLGPARRTHVRDGRRIGCRCAAGNEHPEQGQSRGTAARHGSVPSWNSVQAASENGWPSSFVIGCLQQPVGE